LLHDHGIAMSKRQIAMDQNGDISLNLTPQLAAEMWRGGLINQSQLGAIANGGHARFSFAHNDLLVSSSTGFSQSGRRTPALGSRRVNRLGRTLLSISSVAAPRGRQ
jgi:conjugal transfer mating pair stabilization protein TraG